jgi:hypothetical protein
MLGGNYWADPNGTGFSQTALYDRGDGIVDHAYVIDANNSDYYPLGGKPKPSGGVNVAAPNPLPLIGPGLPYDSKFVKNDIPKTMQSCGSYQVHVQVMNTGSVNWTSANGVFLSPSSKDGFTFVPPRYWLPEGVVVKPGASYTFPFTINVPCPMKNGTYNLSFIMMYTVTSQSGAKVHVPFGEDYQYTVTVSTPTSSVASSGLSKFIKSGTPKAIVPQNGVVVNTQNYVNSAPTGAGQQTITSPLVTPVKNPAITSFSQVTTPTIEKPKIISETGYASTPLPEFGSFAANTTGSTLASRFPLISSVFWLNLLQTE